MWMFFHRISPSHPTVRSSTPRRCNAAMRNPALRARSAAGRGAARRPVASHHHWAVCDLTLQDTAKRTKFLP